MCGVYIGEGGNATVGKHSPIDLAKQGCYARPIGVRGPFTRAHVRARGAPGGGGQSSGNIALQTTLETSFKSNLW